MSEDHGPEYRHVDEMDWETLSLPRAREQDGVPPDGPSARASRTPASCATRRGPFTRGIATTSPRSGTSSRARSRSASASWARARWSSTPIRTTRRTSPPRRAASCSSSSTRGRSTGKAPIYDGRFNMAERKPLSEENLAAIVAARGAASRRRDAALRDQSRGNDPLEREARRVAVSEGLTAHALPITRVPGFHRIAVFARDEGSAIVAGVAGTINWNWLHIGLVWVSEPLRRSGIGRRLIGEIERVAVERGCAHAHLDTFSYQARPVLRAPGLPGLRRPRGLPVGPAALLHAEGLREAGDRLSTRAALRSRRDA